MTASAALRPVPKEAIAALKTVRGKTCYRGVVFMDGKYLPPPYLVKRVGTAIYINDVQVTSPLVPWEDFIRTQDGVRTEAPQTAAPASDTSPSVSPSSAPIAQEDDDPLADLFDDVPVKKPSHKSASRSDSREKAKPAPAPTLVLSGDFVPNAASRKLLARIDDYRNDVNAQLLRGGFFFFGSNYARVSGDSREARRLLKLLPGVMKDASSAGDLYARACSAGFHYLNQRIAAGIYRNRYLYTQIEQRVRNEKRDELLGISL